MADIKGEYNGYLTRSKIFLILERPMDEQLNLENLIKNYITRIDSLKQDYKKQKSLFQDSFESDAVYVEHDQQAKEATRIKVETKLQILKQPALAELAAKLVEMRDEIKELEVSLSDYLWQYQKLTGASEIEGEDGETRLIVNTVKLVKSAKPR